LREINLRRQIQLIGLVRIHAPQIHKDLLLFPGVTESPHLVLRVIMQSGGVQNRKNPEALGVHIPLYIDRANEKG
jgi:hypothetical protein